MGLINRETGETVIDDLDGNPLASVVYTVESLMWIEAHLQGRSVMQVLEAGRHAHWKASELQILVWAGMEAHRRREGGLGGQVNPAKALDIIEQGGGLNPVAMLVMDALMRSTALGLNPDRNRPQAKTDPTMGGASSSDSAPPAFTPQRPTA